MLMIIKELTSVWLDIIYPAIMRKTEREYQKYIRDYWKHIRDIHKIEKTNCIDIAFFIIKTRKTIQSIC